MTRAGGLVGDVVCELGEGPVWRADSARCGGSISSGRRSGGSTPKPASAKYWPAPERIGFIEPVAGGGWIAGLKSGLHRFDESHQEIVRAPSRTIEDPALDNRLNDAFVDAAGRLWFGSMHDAPRTRTPARSTAWTSGASTRHDDGYGITNGPSTSPDGRVFYHTDTRASSIYAFDLSTDGVLTNRRTFAASTPPTAGPDGSTVDAEGCVWTALWGGWGVRRYSPEGEVVGFVRFPVANVTKIAFGGDDLATALRHHRLGRPDAGRSDRTALGGPLFSFASGTRGQPQYEVLHA